VISSSAGSASTTALEALAIPGAHSASIARASSALSRSGRSPMDGLSCLSQACAWPPHRVRSQWALPASCRDGLARPARPAHHCQGRAGV